MALAAAALLPATAHAATDIPGSKLVNDKPSWLASGLCPAAGPSAAPAAPLDAASVILGGAPSALDRIRMSQQGEVEPAPMPAIAAPIRMVATPASLSLEPASRAPVSLTRAVAPAPTDNCGNRAISPKIRFGQSFQDFTTVAPELDPTSELGTRAIPVKRTRFDDRWNHVRQAPPASLMQAQLLRAGVTRGLAEGEVLQRVNQWVNRQIAYVNDDRNYRQSDYWATAEQTLTRGSGDCEDFAILKMHMLRAAGIDPDRVKLVLLRDLAANADHAFLLVQSQAGKVVLDNMTDRVYSGNDGSSVRPVLSFSGNQRWIHAYRGVQPTPLAVSVPAAQKPFAVAMIANQRSVSAELLTFKTGLSR